MFFLFEYTFSGSFFFVVIKARNSGFKLKPLSLTGLEGSY